MRNLLLVLGIAFCLASTTSIAFAATASPVTWYTSDGKELSLEKATKLLAKYDVVMFGEFHDNTNIHKEQLAFLEQFYKVDKNVALSLEMIEKDNKDLLEKYLKGEVTEEYFIANSRPWQNYVEDYAPMVNFCKNNERDVIASNIPRFLANQYAKSGTLDNIEADKKQYLPRVHIADKDRYYEEFAKVMSKGAMATKPEMVWNFYRAQCIKDDVMAQSIFDYLKDNPKTKVLHMQGSFHGRYHLGVADKLQRLDSKLKIAVISPVYITEDEKISDVINQYNTDGDFILFVKK